ncbi:MAG TPA: MlaD family protein, partial [Candidatus Babeliales bacterium]|nr:MlaD family protein [Candidatus Babeliales bacterium]
MQISTEAKVGFFVLVALGILGSMAYYLGVFRFDLKLFNTYYAHFQDASGLDDKAHVKIAGVKVGWVDDVILEDHGGKVRIKLMIRNQYLLHHDAQVTIRQESLLGSKYIDITPGSAE